MYSHIPAEMHMDGFLECRQCCDAVVDVLLSRSTLPVQLDVIPLGPRAFTGGPHCARNLVGKHVIRTIVRRHCQLTFFWRILEVEYYGGSTKWPDPASYAERGLQKGRPMHGPAGCVYIAHFRGNYSGFNITAEGVGEPGAILVTKAELLCEENGRGPLAGPSRKVVVSGPDKVRRAMHIHKGLEGHDLTRVSGLFLAESCNGKFGSETEVTAAIRRGIHDDRQWRFLLAEKRTSDTQAMILWRGDK